jgi:hypothetical protein
MLARRRSLGGITMPPPEVLQKMGEALNNLREELQRTRTTLFAVLSRMPDMTCTFNAEDGATVMELVAKCELQTVTDPEGRSVTFKLIPQAAQETPK